MPRHRAALAWAAFFLVLAAVGACGLLDVVVDPYGEVGLFHTRNLYLDHFSGAYAAYARLERPGTQDLVFGSSLSGTIGPEQLKAPVLNLSSTVYGKPENIRDFLAGLDAAQWSHIGRVYCLADIRLMDGQPGDYQGRDFHSQWRRWLEAVRNINGTKVFRALDKLRANLGGDMPAYVDGDGVLRRTGPRPFKTDNYFESYGRDLNYSQRQGDALRQVDQLLRAHQKPVTYFCTVLSDYFWCRMNPASIEPHYRCILDAVGSMVCLDYVPAYSSRMDLFRDEVHHEDSLTDWECSILLDPRAARPYVITPSNYRSHVAALLAHIRRCHVAG